MSPPVKNKSLGDTVIIGQISVREFGIGKSERILNSEFLREPGHLVPVTGTADVQTDDMQTLRRVTFLQCHQVRRLFAAWRNTTTWPR